MLYYTHIKEKRCLELSFLEREQMKQMLDELSTGELDESRRVEIINEIGQQHNAGLEEYEGLQQTLEQSSNQLIESRDAMAQMYNQLNAHNLGTGIEVAGTQEEEDTQATISLDELLGTEY